MRLRPAPHCRTAITAYSLKIEPAGHFINWQQDPQSNFLARIVFPQPVSHFHVEVDLVAEMTVINPFDFFLEPSAETFPFRYEAELAEELRPYLVPEPMGPALGEFMQSIDRASMRTIDFLVHLNQLTQRSVGYVIRLEPGIQTPEQTLTQRTGSCRDSAWLLVQAFRNLGVAARFVSGYLIQLKPDDGAPGPTRDFTDLHAWTEVYVPGAGWIGLDPTSGLFAGEGHIPLAATPLPSAAAPVTGAVGECKVEFIHEMSVTRIREEPRVTLPYSDRQWHRIEALGHQVDRELVAGDVRLTMGGEPTFVSAGNRDAEEWNTGALGDEKLALARDLLERLRKTHTSGALVHVGQGKWYPGEPLPRWALGCYWRADCVPLWRNQNLFAKADDEQKFLYGEAATFGRFLAVRLGVDPKYVRPTFEERALSAPAGFALPLKRAEGKGWESALWSMRGKDLILVFGDSPMGFRLPLASRPWGESEVRTALCVETRAGRVHIFMPPADALEDYIDLLTAVEDTAGSSGIPVVIEGYTPPTDPRIRNLKITPDPGVIEVNVQPAGSWAELVRNTEALYQQARLTGLSAEKFMLDGKHTGTGGGNHVVLGAATPADSPFLRRPDVLRSMLAYWLNHPSLSYLFSGMFIGPTSQAPRVDETRADSMYELEIAFRQIPEGRDKPVPPWLVDRIFRHLLVDVTGNTHRAEFCIDKLYSPDSSTGRLGLVELRGFEMPPHARMSLTQQLLVRALVAWFWKKPYLRDPMRWGTRLHDAFMLPHFVSGDFSEVLEDLKRAGFAFDTEWFATHFEFRYPTLGHVTHGGVTIELRQATEPWYVLGEEQSAGSTARFVDSSLERLQAKVSGRASNRYVVTCNGRRLPLHTDGVAGVRYRAWQPPSCLHPTIPVHTPLVFDVVDTWTGRSIGGCTYHVTHPGGRSYDTFPVNANEAEARRAARFFASGHTPGPMELPPVEENPDYPLTLDLRRPVATRGLGSV